MKNLYNKQDITDMVQRLENLTMDSKCLWGTMRVDQMLVHLNLSFEPALGLSFPKRKFISRILGTTLKRVYLDKEEMIKNARTIDSYVATGEYDFEKVRREAIENLKLFYSNGPEKCSSHPHPYFGKLTPEEWATLKWRHFDHHLRQFGV